MCKHGLFLFFFHQHFSKLAWPASIMPTITPKRPSAVAKISITRIFTKSFGFCASASAQPLPQIPTVILLCFQCTNDECEDNITQEVEGEDVAGASDFLFQSQYTQASDLSMRA